MVLNVATQLHATWRNLTYFKLSKTYQSSVHKTLTREESEREHQGGGWQEVVGARQACSSHCNLNRGTAMLSSWCPNWSSRGSHPRWGTWSMTVNATWYNLTPLVSVVSVQFSYGCQSMPMSLEAHLSFYPSFLCPPSVRRLSIWPFIDLSGICMVIPNFSVLTK